VFCFIHGELNDVMGEQRIICVTGVNGCKVKGKVVPYA
jgi:hypothetical protein